MSHQEHARLRTECYERFVENMKVRLYLRRQGIGRGFGEEYKPNAWAEIVTNGNTEVNV